MVMKMKQYKNLLFDADGTLLDFEKSEHESLILTFQQYQIPITDELLETYQRINNKLWDQFEQGLITKQTIVDTRFVILFKQMNIIHDGLTFEKDYQNNLAHSYYLLGNIKELIHQLSQSYNLYVVTNGIAKTQYQRLEGTGIKDDFKGIFISEEIGYQKPDIQFFDYCFSQIPNFQYEETLIIGDSLTSDILGGFNAHIDTCWLYQPHTTITNPQIITYTIYQLHDLLNILKKTYD